MITQEHFCSTEIAHQLQIKLSVEELGEQITQQVEEHNSAIDLLIAGRDDTINATPDVDADLVDGESIHANRGLRTKNKITAEINCLRAVFSMSKATESLLEQVIDAVTRLEAEAHDAIDPTVEDARALLAKLGYNTGDLKFNERVEQSPIVRDARDLASRTRARLADAENVLRGIRDAKIADCVKGEIVRIAAENE